MLAWLVKWLNHTKLSLIKPEDLSWCIQTNNRVREGIIRHGQLTDISYVATCPYTGDYIK